MPVHRGTKHRNEEGGAPAEEQELTALIGDYLETLQQQGRNAPLPQERLDQLPDSQRDRALFTLRMLRASWGAGLSVSPSPVQAHQPQAASPAAAALEALVRSWTTACEASAPRSKNRWARQAATCSDPLLDVLLMMMEGVTKLMERLVELRRLRTGRHIGAAAHLPTLLVRSARRRRPTTW
jgi:hypothetical protein